VTRIIEIEDGRADVHLSELAGVAAALEIPLHELLQRAERKIPR
jgi:hypothetical protein